MHMRVWTDDLLRVAVRNNGGLESNLRPADDVIAGAVLGMPEWGPMEGHGGRWGHS